MSRRIQMLDSNTRSYPRTLQEAFGPHTSRDIQDDSKDYPGAWWVCMWVIVVVTMVLVGVTS